MMILLLCACLVGGKENPKPADTGGAAVLVSGKKVGLDELAKNFEKKHGLTEADRSEDGAHRMLDKDYVNLTLGVFDLRYPIAALGDAKRAHDLNDIALLLIKMQQRWVEWLGADAATKTDAGAAADALTRWLKTVKPPELAKATEKSPTERDPLVLLKADPALMKSEGTFESLMRKGKYLSAPRATPLEIPVVISPNRSDFVHLASYLGSLSNQNRATFWVDSMPSWSDLRWGDMTVLALEFALPTKEGVDITKGLDMNEREPTGLLQNVCFKLMTTLAAKDLGKSLDPTLHQALITNLVIDVVGENNVTIGAGASTAAYSRFVPGGKSSGGKLAKRSAEGRFRDSKGKDHFVGTLKDFFAESETQRLKAHAVAPGDDGIAIALYAHDDRDPHFLDAPFLDSNTKRAIPPPYEDDSKEFLRAYGSAFLFWLQTKAVVQSNTPEAMLGSLMKGATVAAGGEPFAFEAKVKEIYGVPWSAPDLKTDSLEGRFLRWLTKP